LVGFTKVPTLAGGSATVDLTAPLPGPLLVALHARDPDAVRV
jgi:hypothetical protein